MMKKTCDFYVLAGTYSPSTANTQRLMSFVKAWSEFGYKLTIVFILPDKEYAKVSESIAGITFVYLWEKLCFIHNRYLHYSLYWLFVLQFRSRLTVGDKVLLYGQGNLISFFMKKKEIKVYHECSEHPDVSRPGIFKYRISTKKYIKACRKLNALFVICNNLKKYFIENGVDAKKVVVVNMTVDTKRFDGLLKSPTKEKGVYLAYCGKASNYKDGVDQMIKAFSIHYWTIR